MTLPWSRRPSPETDRGRQRALEPASGARDCCGDRHVRAGLRQLHRRRRQRGRRGVLRLLADGADRQRAGRRHRPRSRRLAHHGSGQVRGGRKALAVGRRLGQRRSAHEQPETERPSVSSHLDSPPAPQRVGVPAHPACREVSAYGRYGKHDRQTWYGGTGRSERHNRYSLRPRLDRPVQVERPRHPLLGRGCHLGVTTDLGQRRLPNRGRECRLVAVPAQVQLNEVLQRPGADAFTIA